MTSIVENPEFETQLSLSWAPVHYQNVDPNGDQSLGGRADYLTAVDFDGDWESSNNWENLAYYRAKAVVYYSVVESETHWFIIYAFYHPRDWIKAFELEAAHENDMEGVLLTVERPQAEGQDLFGAAKSLITVAHLDFFSYVPADSGWTHGPKHLFFLPGEDIDGRLTTETFEGRPHPVTCQEARGHGCKADNQYPTKKPAVRYQPSLTESEEPSHNDDRTVPYKLVSIFEPGGLWDRKDDELLFASHGVFLGDTHGQDKAHAPWRWDDRNDGSQLQGGELATDPIKLIRIYFSNLGNFSDTYTSNRYIP